MNSSHLQSSQAESERSLPLFEKLSAIEAAQGLLNDDLMVRNIITAAIKRCGKSREEIAEQLSMLLGVSVTARMIGSFTAESKELHRWPGAWDRAFCRATGDDTLLRCRAEAAGFKVISGAEIELLELGRSYLKQKRASQALASIEQNLAQVSL